MGQKLSGGPKHITPTPNTIAKPTASKPQSQSKTGPLKESSNQNLLTRQATAGQEKHSSPQPKQETQQKEVDHDREVERTQQWRSTRDKAQMQMEINPRLSGIQSNPCSTSPTDSIVSHADVHGIATSNVPPMEVSSSSKNSLKL